MSSDGRPPQPLEPRAWRVVAGYLDGLAEDGRPLVTRIHPDDEMYGYERRMPYRTREAAAISYFATGHQIFRTVRDLLEWRFGRLDAVSSLLDFASGYGRLTRFLVRAMPPDRITCSEIDAAAVRFQQDTFGVRGLVSRADPELVPLADAHDAILAVSFFSHLPESSFESWLRRLRSGLAPGGVLAFSVHGMDLLPAEERDAAAGIVFRPVSETKRLDAAQYGTSYLTDAFVRAAVRRAGASEDRLLVFPRGLGALQDLYVFLAPPAPEAPAPRLARHPLGTCDFSSVADGVLSLGGWAEGDAGERPPDVRLFVGNAVAAHSPCAAASGGGARRVWSFAHPLSAIDPDEVVRVEAESERELSRILVIGTTRPYLPAPPL